MANLKNTTIDGNFELPKGAESDRPTNPAVGAIRFNTDTSILEKYNGQSWGPIIDRVQASASGSVYTMENVDAGVPYTTHVFTDSGTFSVSQGGEVEYLIVAGGGGGGGIIAGGGGAGGLLTGITNVTPQAYTITVGGGGLGGFGWNNPGQQGSRGENSSAFGLTAIGGGGGGWHGDGGGTTDQSLLNGGSGGGQARADEPGTGVPGQGNSGGLGSGNTGGGGGGAGSAGQNAEGGVTGGNGGIGVASTLAGYTTFYAGGGGDGKRSGSGRVGGLGGLGGGGRGTNTTAKADDGAANTGGGGGGAGYDSTSTARLGGTGGSGIVIVRYRSNNTDLVESPTVIPSGERNSLVYRIDASDPQSYNIGTDRNTVYDTAGGTTGTLTNVDFSGENGGQFVFSGNGKISVPSSDTYKVNFPWTIIAWVKYTNSGSIICLDSINCGANDFSPVEYRGAEWTINGSNGMSYLLGCGGCGGSGRRSGGVTANLSTNEWYHLAIQTTQKPYTFQRPPPRFYVDGEDIGEGSVGGTNSVSSMCYTDQPMTIGSRIDDSRQLTGSIGELRIYNRAYGGAAIKKDFLATKARYGK